MLDVDGRIKLVITLLFLTLVQHFTITTSSIKVALGIGTAVIIAVNSPMLGCRHDFVC